MSAVVRVFDRAIVVYQRATEGRVSPCRHIPSCSTYGREALELHGAAKGSWLTVKRICRCNPWGTEGFDPVPGSPDAERLLRAGDSSLNAT